MKPSSFFVLLACALLTLAAAASACGGGSATINIDTAGTPGGGASLEEYFQQVQALEDQSSQRLSTLEGRLQTSGTGVAPDQAIQVVRDTITGQAAILRDLRDGLQGLTPPPEVKDAHQEAIDALEAFIEFSQTASEQAEAATDLIEVAAVLSSEEAGEANTRLQNACLGLVSAAASNGITISMSCGQ